MTRVGTVLGPYGASRNPNGRPAKHHWFLEDEDFKDCRKCGVRKKGREFHRFKKAVDGRAGACKACRNADCYRLRTPESRKTSRERHKVAAAHRERRRRYGITPEWFDAQVASQNGGCAICGQRPRNDKTLTVDHDHTTGVVRGLLCSPCNGALGKLGDTIEGLERALAYLRGELP